MDADQDFTQENNLTSILNGVDDDDGLVLQEYNSDEETEGVTKEVDEEEEHVTKVGKDEEEHLLI